MDERPDAARRQGDSLPALLSVIYLLLVISTNINGHLHDSDLPGRERDKWEEKGKERKFVVSLPPGLSLSSSASGGHRRICREESCQVRPWQTGV